MSEVYNDYEQGQRVKAWIKEYAGAIALGIILAFGVYYGSQYLRDLRANKNAEAAQEYRALTQAVQASNLDLATDHYEAIKVDFADGIYHGMAAMQIASARMDAGQTDLAISDLQIAAADSMPEAIRYVARGRLARLYIDQGRIEDAEALISNPPEGFAGRYAEIQGDVHYAKGEYALAKTAWEEAMAAETGASLARNFLQLKLDNLPAELLAAPEIEPVFVSMESIESTEGVDAEVTESVEGDAEAATEAEES